MSTMKGSDNRASKPLIAFWAKLSRLSLKSPTTLLKTKMETIKAFSLKWKKFYSKILESTMTNPKTPISDRKLKTQVTQIRYQEVRL